MRAYLIRRLLLMIPTAILVSLGVFFLVRFIPGDVIDAMLAQQEFHRPGIDRALIEQRLGLDVPISFSTGAG
jgi:peptide/nickel transport system permease protein